MKVIEKSKATTPLSVYTADIGNEPIVIARVENQLQLSLQLITPIWKLLH